MKKLIKVFCCFVGLTISVFVNASTPEKTVIKYDKKGIIKSVSFSLNDNEYGPIRSSDMFFRGILKVKENNHFAKNQSIRLDGRNETFEQYYKGIKVENAGYTFHYDDNGCMRYAHGNYVDISFLDINPVLTEEEACIAFAKFKGLSPNSIIKSSAELIIKNIKNVDSEERPLLVYKVLMEAKDMCITDYGYVDAKTGNVVYTETFINHNEPVGTFHTKYYGTKYATTYLVNNSYYVLRDASRGLGIETDDLRDHNINQTGYVVPISDNDNNWYYSDYTDSTFMALDVHWALQKIYDRLYYAHGKNSMNNNGKRIIAYVNALVPSDFGGLYTSDNSCWSNTQAILFFGNGSFFFYKRPLSSLDIVAHEFGHGITHYQIGWSGDEDFLNEGLSDIWGAIMDYRYGDANTEIWKIGERTPYSYYCQRNLITTLSSDARSKMADTYNSTKYNEYQHDGDIYGMSGVFSHWFYLLVNGGQGCNANGQYYTLNPIGMDVAENLIVKAVYDNYLRYTTSYEDVKESFVAAASSMSVDGLVDAVKDAWYAVGVGLGSMNLNIVGPSLINYQGIYSIEGLPTGYDVTWTLSNPYYNLNCLQQNTPVAGQCTITRSSSYDMENATLTASIKLNGTTIGTRTKGGLYTYYGFKGHYVSYDLSGDIINNTYLFYVRPNYTTTITSPNFIGATVSYDTSATIPLNWNYSSTSGEVNFTVPLNNNNIPVVIDVNDVCGNYYQLYAMPQNTLYLNLSSGENDIKITLGVTNDTSRNLNSECPWTLEIRNVTTGELMTTRTSMNRSTSVSTLGWPKGLYAVKVIVDKEELIEKMVIR